ncbi:hypothetical protein PIB30_093988, partial [Stylosanthes scabra]|nr:hypothetical protein [Stylosanthes scabra]
NQPPPPNSPSSFSTIIEPPLPLTALSNLCHPRSYLAAALKSITTINSGEPNPNTVIFLLCHHFLKPQPTQPLLSLKLQPSSSQFRNSALAPEMPLMPPSFFSPLPAPSCPVTITWWLSVLCHCYYYTVHLLCSFAASPHNYRWPLLQALICHHCWAVPSPPFELWCIIIAASPCSSNVTILFSVLC